MAFRLLAPALVAAALACGSALADTLPDRSRLSYDENVIINSACFNDSRKGEGPFADCVGKQLAALVAHPTPDRSKLAPARLAEIDRNCGYLRRTGIGEYNECVKRTIAGPPPKPIFDAALPEHRNPPRPIKTASK